MTTSPANGEPREPMRTPQAIEAAVEEVVQALLRDWASPDPAATARFLDRIAEDFTGHGTGPGDYYADPAALRAMVHREHEGMSYPFTLTVPWMKVRLVRPAVALAEGLIRIEIDMGEEVVIEAPRFSFLLEQQAGGRWLLAHFHFSVPDMLQEEGGTMDDLLATRNQELQRLVAERTADLEAAQAQLVQQEKMASLGQLTAGIAHEIKNPLNFVNNFASVARELTDELAEALAAGETEEAGAVLGDLKASAARIEEHGRRADAIVRSMMQHARGSEGSREAVDLNALVAEYVELAYHGQRARQPAFHCEVERDYDEAVGEVEVLRQDVGRVVLNLVANAFDAVTERAAQADAAYAPCVRVATRRRAETVEIRVADNGGGVPASMAARIFEPFFTTKPAGSGTGLGLSLSYDIVTQGHGGTLTLERADGDGATFIVALPAPR